MLVMAAVTVAGWIAPVDAATKPAKKPQNPAFATVADDPALPRVLLIGDSISIGYTIPVREALQGKANVHRPAMNCGPSSRGVEHIESWLGEKKWDVIHFNFGLHDLKYIDEQGKNTAPAKGRQQVAIEQYEKNLESLVERMKRSAEVVIFATTTPVPEGERQRVHDDAIKYNEVARRVMQRQGVRVNDLHALVAPRQKDVQSRPGDVHFTREGYQLLGAEVAKQIEAALAK